MKFAVDIIESESGWGQKLDERKLFDSADKAYKFVEEFNSKLDKDTVPYWYMYAEDPIRIE